ncbi:MAG: hypothetical protein KDD33_12375 [Bdellovibrionales bacterium]|nr:hypothetical protein [Bdellovibrionales bacterium]
MRFLKFAALVSLSTMIASAAMACPSGLRPFNKQLEGKDTCVLEGTYVGNLELSSGFNYILLGPVFIGKEVRDANLNLVEPIEPATLTVAAGVKMFGLNPEKDKTGVWSGFTMANGQPVQGDVKTFMSVTRDSRIEILGKETAPVLMTSAQGAHQATPAAEKQPGDWGGLVISGKAKSNKCTTFADCTLPGEADTGYYAGDDDNHSSGVIQYLQVEYGGDRIDDEKELNGITFNAVGLGTVVENIAVLYNSDDCVEFFGGAVMARNVFCYKGLDDGIDTTDGARIFLQNGIVVNGDYPNAGADNDRHAVEADSSKSDAASLRLRSHPMLVNFTFIGGLNTQGFKLRRGTDYTIVNSAMTGFDLWCMDPTGANLLDLYTNVFADCNTADPVKGQNNNDFVTATDMKVKGWIPEAGSPLTGGAAIIETFSDDPNLDEAFADFYQEVEYRGAIGANDWTTWIQIRD